MLMNKTKSTSFKKNGQDEQANIMNSSSNVLNNRASTNSIKLISNSDNSLNQISCATNSNNNNNNSNSNNIKKERANDRFHQLFPTIPIYETVLQSYSCAYIKSINLYHGIMFLTSNYICFYSKIFSHETILVFKWKDVSSITKTNYAFMFPTAIRIDTTQSTYAFTTFRSRTQTYDTLIELWNTLLKKQSEISKAKPNDVLDFSLKLEKEKQEIEEKLNNENKISNELDDSSDTSQSSSSNSIVINQNNDFYCRANFDNSRNYFFYDLNFSQLSNQTVTVSLRHKKSILQKAKVLLGCLIPGFFNISRIDSLLPICFLMCILLLLNAFVLLHKVNQVDELFTKLLKPI